MALSVFVLESLGGMQLTSISLERVRMDLRAYLTEHNQIGELEVVEACDESQIQQEMTKFVKWQETVPPDHQVVLWISMHGIREIDSTAPRVEVVSAVPPPNAVGTAVADAKGNTIEWYKLLGPLRQRCRAGTVFLLDVCWGASPAAARCLTSTTPSDGCFLFGPTRKAARVELDGAASLVFGTLCRFDQLTSEHARRVVNALNDTFHPESNTERPFYRVWSWDTDGAIVAHPFDPNADRHKVRRSS